MDGALGTMSKVLSNLISSLANSLWVAWDSDFVGAGDVMFEASDGMCYACNAPRWSIALCMTCRTVVGANAVEATAVNRCCDGQQAPPRRRLSIVVLTRLLYVGQ